jgi:hypothetical protein
MGDDKRYKELSRKLIKQWQKEKIELNRGATEDELNNFEIELNIKLPEDFRYFYSLVNGMQEGSSDKYFFELWSLNNILKKEEGVLVYVVEAKSKIEVPFGDWLIDSHRYSLVFDRFGASCIKVDGDAPPIFLTSFISFLEAYLFDPDSVCLWII